jgi:hypothetical protein
VAKRTIIIGWIAGTIAQVPGAILIIASFVALLAHLEPVTRYTNFNILLDGYGWTMVGLMVLGGIIAGAGMIVQLAAWIGALLNSHRLADRRWFTALLWGGIVGIVTTPLFGLGILISGSAVIAYLVGGPDAIASQRPTILEKRTIAQWSIWGAVAMVAGSFFPLFVAHATNEGGFLHGLLWPALALDTLSAAVAVCGVIAVTVAWWGAVFNSHRLADRTWFNLLLWSGLVGALTSPLFGVSALVSEGVLIAYLVAGPDGMAVATPPTAMLAPTS